MTVTATLKNVESKTDWSTTFPEDLQIEKLSGIFAFRLIRITTAFILDKRSLLKEECFKTRNIEKLLVANFNTENPTAKRLVDKLEELKTAIHNRFLREFAIVFYRSPNEEDIFEVYTFRLNYNEEGDVSLSLDTGIGSEEFSQSLLLSKFENLEQTKALFVSTMKKLHRCMKGLEDIPDCADASFRIAFTENAPKKYMPKGFDESELFYKLNPSIMNVELGTMCGGHHKIQLLAASQLVKPGRTCDLNQTSISMNQSILDTPINKRRASDRVQKKAPSEKRARPYGQTGPMTTGHRRVLPA